MICNSKLLPNSKYLSSTYYVSSIGYTHEHARKRSLPSWNLDSTWRKRGGRAGRDWEKEREGKREEEGEMNVEKSKRGRKEGRKVVGSMCLWFYSFKK